MLRAKLKKLLILTPIAILCLGNESCKDQRPKFDAKVYVGHPPLAGVVSSRNELVTCENPYFEEFVCMHADDLKKLEKEVLSKCERWKQ